jgi:hypothetical protein
MSDPRPYDALGGLLPGEQRLPGAAGAFTPSSTDLAELDAYEEEPEAIKMRPHLMTKLTWVLLFVLTLGAGFVAGAKVQKSRTPATTTAAAAIATRAGTGTGTNRTAGSTVAGATGATGATGQGATGQGRNGGVPAGATVGQVKLVDGNNLYVQDTAGDIIKVITTPAIAVQVTKAGTIADLKPGDTVIVQGQANPDGSVNATTVRSGAAGGFGGGGFGGTGTGGTGTGTGGTGATGTGATGTGRTGTGQGSGQSTPPATAGNG